MHQYKYISALLAALLLVGCGGGGAGDQTSKVKFTSQVSFGDSLSDVGSYKVGTVLAMGGGQFTINGAGKNWTELMATQLGLAAPCAAQTGLVTVPGITGEATTTKPNCTGYAQGGALVTGSAGIGNPASLVQPGIFLTVPVQQQITNHLATLPSGKFSGGEMVLVLAGANDVFTQFGLLTGGATQAATAAVTAAATAGTCAPTDAVCTGIGETAANTYIQANATASVTAVGTAAAELSAYVKTMIVGNGAKYVTVLNVPDINSTPFAATLPASVRPLLTTMLTTFNSQLSTALAGNANVLLVDVYTANKDQIANPAIYGLTNVTNTACDLTNATNPAAAGFNPLKSSLVCSVSAKNLIAGDTSHYLFADSVHPTPYGYLLMTRLVAKEMAVKGWI